MEIQKTALRLPKDLHQMVIESAQKSGHSMNAEIIARLRSSFENNEIQSDNHIRDIAREIVRDELKKLNK